MSVQEQDSGLVWSVCKTIKNSVWSILSLMNGNGWCFFMNPETDERTNGTTARPNVTGLHLVLCANEWMSEWVSECGGVNGQLYVCEWPDGDTKEWKRMTVRMKCTECWHRINSKDVLSFYWWGLWWSGEYDWSWWLKALRQIAVDWPRYSHTHIFRHPLCMISTFFFFLSFFF